MVSLDLPVCLRMIFSFFFLLGMFKNDKGAGKQKT
jgi:hypothetical protein